SNKQDDCRTDLHRATVCCVTCAEKARLRDRRRHGSDDAGSLDMLGLLDEAKAFVAHSMAKYPGLLSIEKFALNHDWAAPASAVMVSLMRKAGFPACASRHRQARAPAGMYQDVGARGRNKTSHPHFR